jgi:hypothetical protein
MKYFIALLAVASCLWGCTGNFDEINRNRNQVTKEDMQRENYIIGSTLKGLQGFVVPVQEHLHQFYDILAGDSFAGYMEATPVWSEKFSTYNPPSNWLAAPFKDVISGTYPFYRDIYNQTDDPVALAMADVLRVAIMHRLTDTYGPIPYSKVMEGENESLKVPYDPQKEVYDKMFEELAAAIAVFNENRGLNAETFAKFDNVFYGDIIKWIKYSNSLKLRMAMRIVYIEPDRAKTLAEEAVTGGVIEQNSDNALMHVEENRAAMIYNDWKDHCVGADIISYMNGYKDPRREKMFTLGMSKDGKVRDYYGMRIGIDVANKDEMVAIYSRPVITGADPYLWMNAAEVTFLRAEGALRGWTMGGDAETLYNNAIKLSFEERGALGADNYIGNDADTPMFYFDPLDNYGTNSPASYITVKWNSDEGGFEENLERIITQKWIAIFPLGVEAWAEYRRTGYPKLMPMYLNKSGSTINSALRIRRLPYPADEYTENSTNVQAAVGMLNGPDNGGTRLWWDCKE